MLAHKMPMDERRQHVRLDSAATVQLELLGEHISMAEVRVIDVSLTGVRVECGVELKPGTAVAIRHGDVLYLGEIIWYAGGHAGIELEHMLDMGRLEELRRES